MDQPCPPPASLSAAFGELGGTQALLFRLAAGKSVQSAFFTRWRIRIVPRVIDPSMRYRVEKLPENRAVATMTSATLAKARLNSSGV